METLKDKINTLIEDYQRRFKTIKKEIAKGGNDITLTRLGTKASEYQTFVSELSRLKDEGEDKLTCTDKCRWFNIGYGHCNFCIRQVKEHDCRDNFEPAEQSDKSIISATNDNPFGAVKELAEQTKNDVEVDSDVKIYNERQDLQAQFRKPAEQSGKLSAEEWKQKLCGYIEKSLKSAHLKDGENHLVDILSNGPTIQGGIEEIENIVEQIYFDMEEYASQFVGEKVTNEMIEAFEEKVSKKRKGYYCSICHDNPVDAENGYDTCQECLSKQ